MANKNRTIERIKISGTTVGKGCACFIIAEAGVNHNGSKELAKELIDAAVYAGANAVKFQTFCADKLVVPSAPKAGYQRDSSVPDESQMEMLRKLELPADAWKELREYASKKQIIFLSTPFDENSARLLFDLEVPAFKVSSGDVTNLPFLRYIAQFGIPVILSTGMSTMDEVGQAVSEIRFAGNRQIILLHCVSNYPARPEDVNLKAMTIMADKFGFPVGFSDHTTGNEVAIASVALGACVVEKHMTLNRNLPGPDHKASQTPDEFAALVRSIRVVESALGDGRKKPSESEKDIAFVVRRSLVAVRNIPAGEQLKVADVEIKRPGTGLPPSALVKIVGKRVVIPIPAGTLLRMDMVA
jgi:N,N'-diacetyllegionaminate synthase